MTVRFAEPADVPAIQLPAVTHVNGSARVQTVSSKDNAEFHALLRAVGERTGREWFSTPAST
jgi:predicted NodU family carbamoyl transferase